MKTNYLVELKCDVRYTYQIEAENEEAAKKEALKQWELYKFPFPVEFISIENLYEKE